MTQTQTDDEFHDEAHYAFVAIALQNGKRSLNQQKRAFEAWLARYVPQANARGFIGAELTMRRNVAGWLLGEAIDARRPVRAFEPMLRELEALGWNDLEEKSRQIDMVCGYFARRMWKREALRYFLPLKREVEQEYARTGEKTWANCLRRLARTEARLRARSRPF